MSPIIGFSFHSIRPFQVDSLRKIRLDTLRIQSISNGQGLKWYESPALPWVSAVIVAILGVLVNLYIANRTREISVKHIETQLADSTRMAASKFKATLYATNRHG